MAKAVRYFHGHIERETEKAILAKFCISADGFYDINGHYHSACKYATAWLPKSQIETYARLNGSDGESIIWKVPLWLCNKNYLPTITKKIADELVERFAA